MSAIGTFVMAMACHATIAITNQPGDELDIGELVTRIQSIPQIAKWRNPRTAEQVITYQVMPDDSSNRIMFKTAAGDIYWLPPFVERIFHWTNSGVTIYLQDEHSPVRSIYIQSDDIHDRNHLAAHTNWPGAEEVVDRVRTALRESASDADDGALWRESRDLSELYQMDDWSALERALNLDARPDFMSPEILEILASVHLYHARFSLLGGAEFDPRWQKPTIIRGRIEGLEAGSEVSLLTWPRAIPESDADIWNFDFFVQYQARGIVEAFSGLVAVSRSIDDGAAAPVASEVVLEIILGEVSRIDDR